MKDLSRLRSLDRRVLERSRDLVATVTDADLARPTPCAGWTLRDLLSHMAGQHVGFATAAEGETADASGWRDADLGPDAASARAVYSASAARVTAAFERDMPERGLWLPEIRTDAFFPPAVALGFHLVDYVVHNWDVARTLGLASPDDEESAAAALEVALRVPDGPEFRGPGKAFAAVLPAPDGGSTLDRVLTVLGRSPDWTP
ncbi:hypothetical protein BTM25_18160 [Actinomadura rubteroloni]|uniref:Mycothiol-dependent maleylpyruvate isomerase metal-binding domain-containing protein n=1 Tax=Actinomadura rubteroloni TaxID=1926885 RepID=A0A2P4UQS5_9ACTN|nr:TIGR03086 family metal-binding protein [Actinomadura rubteroloni]POM27402.1 hypothetical protein BTM25_18160 [Actinomadura rubteroloni]